jgi:cysteine-rich repeat protein
LITAKLVDTCDKCVETGTTAECVPMGCGDKVRESPEQCDDGNKDDTDDCTSACKVAHCGDTSVWQGHETCDDGNTSTEVCEYGKKACTVCDDSCQEVPGATIYCGDGVWQKGQEECDPDFDETANTCTKACASTTWCLWTLPPISPSISNYGIITDTLSDNTTGLTWELEADLTDRTWEEAKTYCQALKIGVNSDWRLPTKIEMMSIIDYSIPSPGPVISSRFKNATNDVFWTSSEVSGNNNAFYVQFSYGGIGQQGKNIKYKARCVHS